MRLIAQLERAPIITTMLVLIGIAGLAFFHQFHWMADPQHDVHLAVTREESAARADDFMRDVVGQDVSGYFRTTGWMVDEIAKSFLEQRLGIDETATLAQDGTVRLWAFATRYFRPGHSGNYVVGVGPDGRLLVYRHEIADDARGPSLARDEALSIADAARLRLVPREGDWQLIEGHSEERPRRRDWHFTWQRLDRQIVTMGAGGRDVGLIRVEVVVHGDRADEVISSFQVPNGWAQETNDVTALKQRVMDFDWLVGFWAFVPVALIVSLWCLVRRRLQWRTVLGLALVAGVVDAIQAINGPPSLMLTYDPSMTWLAFIGSVAWRPVLSSMWQILLFGLAGEALYRARFPGHLTLQASFSWRGLMTRHAAAALAVGALVAILDGCFVNIFYFVGSWFGFWVPSGTRYENVYNALLPWLQPLQAGVDPALREDFHYRLFLVPLLALLLGRVLRRERLALWLAVVASALAWGFTHVGYPQTPFFARGLEVALVGIVVGWLMIRFGILAPIAEHFTSNALYAASDIASAGIPSITLIAYAIVTIPFMVAVVAVIRAHLRGGFIAEQGLRNADLSDRLNASSPGAPARWPLPPGLWRAFAWRRRAVVGLSGAGVARIIDLVRH
jgi:hypothetical protein